MSEPPVRAELPGGFSRRTVAWIAAAAAASFAAAVLLTFFGRDLSRPPEAGPSTFSRSVLGHRALAELLTSLGLGVASRETRAGLGSDARHPLVLAEPDPARLAGDTTRRLAALAEEALRRQAPLVLVLPKWTGKPLPERPGWIAGLRLLPPAEVRRPLSALPAAAGLAEVAVRRISLGEPLDCYAFWGEGESLEVQLEPAQLLAEDSRLLPLVRCRGGLLVGVRQLDPARPDSPPLFVVADPDVLNNGGLARADHAALAYGLLARHLGASGIVFDETIHGFERASGLLAEAFRFPLSLVLGQMLLLLAAVLWAGTVRFGKPLPGAAGLPAGKDVLIDNTARLLALGGGAHAAGSLARYYRQSLREVAARLFLPAERRAGETRETLQQISDARRLGVDLTALERRLAGGRANPLELARDIHRWRMEMTDALDRDP